MTEQPKMILPNGDVLRDGDWGLMRGGYAVLVKLAGMSAAYPWLALQRSYTPKGTFFINGESAYDIIARARAPSTRPADEMDLTALCKPFGALHAETRDAWHTARRARDGQPFEMLSPNGQWVEITQNHSIKEGLCYRAARAKPAPAPIRATIPWEFLPPAIQWVAQDANGGWYGYRDRAVPNRDMWFGDGSHDLTLLTFPQGNEHWTKTLQQRPNAGAKP